MITRIIPALLTLVLASAAQAQIPQFPQNLPPNTVVGRSGISAGPAQAIPFANLTALLNNTPNTWTTLQTFNAGIAGTLSTGLGQAINFTQTPSGTQAGSFNANSILVTSSAALTGAAAFLQGLNVNCNAQTTSVQGGINCLEVTTGLNSPSNASNVNHNYVGITGIGQANSADGGTNTGAGAKGAIFGSNFVANAVSGATNLLELTAGEVDCQLQTGASAKLKMCWSIVSSALDAVHGATVDAALTIGAVTGSSGFNSGIQFTAQNGIFPMSAAGILIGSEVGNTTSGIDFTNVTFTGSAFKSTGFSVSPTGVIASGLAGGATGQINLNGSTSGVLSLITAATANQLTITQGITIGINGTTQGTILLAGATSGASGFSASATGGHTNFFTNGVAPTLTAGCTGAGSGIVGTDQGGTVTGSTAAATTCTLTFGTAFATAPNCTVSGQSSPLTGAATVATGTIVVNFASTANYKWSYLCFGA